MEQTLTYALQNGKLKYISDVRTGLECNCICPECKKKLIAKNDNKNTLYVEGKRIAHFAHYYEDDEKKGNSNCGYKSALQILAKVILSENKIITLPEYHYDHNPKNNESIFVKSRKVMFDTIKIEDFIKEAGIRPDIIGEKDGKELYIEIAFTHKVDFEKRNKIKEIGKACIEIDVSDQELDKKKLTHFIENEVSHRKWITSPEMDRKFKDYKESLEKMDKDTNEELLPIDDELKTKEIELDEEIKLLESSINEKIMSIETSDNQEIGELRNKIDELRNKIDNKRIEASSNKKKLRKQNETDKNKLRKNKLENSIHNKLEIYDRKGYGIILSENDYMINCPNRIKNNDSTLLEINNNNIYSDDCKICIYHKEEIILGFDQKVFAICKFQKSEDLKKF